MNTRILPLALLAATLLLSGCTASQAPLDEAAKARITQEVKAVTHAMADNCQRLDIDAALKDCADIPEFLAPGVDGVPADLKAVREGNRAYFATLSSLRFTPTREEVRVLSPELALHVYCYKAEATLRTGEREVFDPAAISLLLRKTGDAWKIVFFHESGAPPRRLPAEAKPKGT